jgi:hypothetical protein
VGFVFIENLRQICVGSFAHFVIHQEGETLFSRKMMCTRIFESDWDMIYSSGEEVSWPAILFQGFVKNVIFVPPLQGWHLGRGHPQASGRCASCSLGCTATRLRRLP